MNWSSPEISFTKVQRATDPVGIKSVQQQLNAAGAGLKVDGVWGKNTEAAYQSYLKNQQSTQLQGLLDGALASVGNIGAAYDAAGQQYTNSQNAAYEATKKNLEQQGLKLADQYNALRGQTYSNARLNAIGNNEVLAAKGLAGNLYDGPASGVSETSRVAQNIGMRNDINAATQQEQSAKDDIANQIIQAGFTRDQNVANYLAEQHIAKVQAEAAAQQQAIQNAMALMEFQNSLAASAGSYSRRGTSTKKTSVETDASNLAAALSGMTAGQRYVFYNDENNIKAIRDTLGDDAYLHLVEQYPIVWTPQPVMTSRSDPKSAKGGGR